jgi:hypothetical protein
MNAFRNVMTVSYTARLAACNAFSFSDNIRHPIQMWDFKFSRRRVWSSDLSSGMYCRVKKLSTDVSDVRAASIIRAVSLKRRSTIILHGSISQKTNLNFINPIHTSYNKCNNILSSGQLHHCIIKLPNFGYSLTLLINFVLACCTLISYVFVKLKFHFPKVWQELPFLSLCFIFCFIRPNRFISSIYRPSLHIRIRSCNVITNFLWNVWRYSSSHSFFSSDTRCVGPFSAHTSHFYRQHLEKFSLLSFFSFYISVLPYLQKRSLVLEM